MESKNVWEEIFGEQIILNDFFFGGGGGGGGGGAKWGTISF